MIQLYSILIWAGYMSLEGCREAYYWTAVGRLPESLKPKNAHPEFLMQRCIVFAPLCYISREWAIIASMACISPFFHNGMYYTIRNYIDKCYPKRWLDQSTNSTAWSTIYLQPWVRVSGFVVGVVLLFINYY